MKDIRFMIEYINRIHKAIGKEIFVYIDRGDFYLIKKGNENIAVVDFINYYDRIKKLLG
mgnify:CR=1 FL=1